MAASANRAEQVLTGMAVIAAIAGAILVFKGPSDTGSYSSVLVGWGLVALAVQVWVLLLLFFAWRNEHDARPAWRAEERV